MLSILIVNWNTRDFLRACLRSTREHPPTLEPLETIVVDNASSDGSAEMVLAEFPEVRLVALKTNTGYAHGNNEAFTVAQGEWLLTLNPDTELESGTLDRAFEAMARHPEWGVLGAKQIHPDEGVQRSIRGFPTLLGIVGDVTGLGKWIPALDSYRMSRFDYDMEQECPQPMGTFLLFRREALEAIHATDAPFDEQFPIFFNEVDLLYRLRQAGWPAGYAPSVRVRHFGGASTRQVRQSMIWESHRSLARYLDKHHRTPLLPIAKAILWLGALVRARGVHAGFRP